MTSEGNSALLPANVDRRPPLFLPLHVFLFVLNNKSLNDWSLGKQFILLRFSGNKINCFPRDQSRDLPVFQIFRNVRTITRVQREIPKFVCTFDYYKRKDVPDMPFLGLSKPPTLLEGATDGVVKLG